MNQREQNRVFRVRSLKEAEAILFSTDTSVIERFFLILFIRAWVFGVNLILRMLRTFLFKQWPYARDGISNIVVYSVGIVGDNVVMLPALAALKRRYPASRITVITNCQMWDMQGAKGILGPSPYKDELIVLDDHPVKRNGFRFLMDYEKFKGVGCELFVNLSPFGNRGWLGAVIREIIFAKKLGANYAVGFRMSTYTGGGIFNTVQYRFVRNEPRRAREVLKELGLKPIENVDLLSHDEAAKESILKKIGENRRDNRPIFVINPGGKFQAQCWAAERFGHIATWLTNCYEATVVISGIAQEENIGEGVVKSSSGTVVNLAGKTSLQELIELLRIAKGCVTNDTGTMHLAAMIGVPTVAIFSTRHSPTHWIPVGNNVVSIFSLEDCSFCYNDNCSDPKCLRNVDKDYVLRELEVLLSERISDKYYVKEGSCPSSQTTQSSL